MELNFLVKGIILGFAVAVPVGPIGVLCIRKTIQFGRFSGFFSGLGAAAADTIYGIIAAFGLTLVSDVMIAQQFWLRLLGGLFLLYLGTKTFLAQPSDKTKPVTHKTLLSDFISTFFLTLTNPLTVFAYLAVFAALGLSGSANNPENASFIVCGVFIGSALWWLILSEGVTLFRKRVTHNVMLWINRGAGMFIAAYGIALLYSLAF